MQENLTLIFDSNHEHDQHSGFLPADSGREPGQPYHFRTAAGPWATAVGSGPSRLGLDRLMASGSGQPALPEMSQAIRGLGKDVVVVDLRQESHAFLGEYPVSWYATKNWANLGKSLAGVQEDERARIRALSGSASAKATRVCAKDSEGHISEFQTEDVAYALAQSEERAARSLGLGSLRIPVADHSRPLDEDVDRFILFIRKLAPGTWLHFHCHAGDGRTTTFMLLYDMLRNAPALGLEELAARQHLLGGVDLLHGQPALIWKEALSRERAAFLDRFYRYARTGTFMTVSWSEHLAEP